MYDISKRKELNEITIEQLRNDILFNLPQDMKVCFNGVSQGYLHIDTKENICSFDSETDSDWYEEPHANETYDKEDEHSSYEDRNYARLYGGNE